MPKIDCITCKGKLYTKPLSCGHSFCPIYTKIEQFKTQKLEKDNFLGTAPGVFVGRYNYPQLNVGILAPPDKVEKDAHLYDSPNDWSERKFSVDDVLGFRGSLINSKFQTHIKSRPKFLEMSQEVALSSTPVNVEFRLEKKPTYWFKTSDVETVMGARATLRKADFNDTPKIDRKVDYVVSDTDLKSAKAINLLYSKGYSETFLTKILSVGTLGVKKNRKLVPTRWSLTATDDTIGKELIREIKNYKETEYESYFGGYLGNYFLILCFPRVWSFELFEMYMPSTLLNPENIIKHTTDHEFYDGRKKYAENCAGGYYAARLGVLEKLKSLKRQSAVVVLRFITDEYTTPLGVWVVRETTRKALQNPRSFDSEKAMIDWARNLIITNFGYNINQLLARSKVMQQIRSQKTISDFF